VDRSSPATNWHDKMTYSILMCPITGRWWAHPETQPGRYPYSTVPTKQARQRDYLPAARSSAMPYALPSRRRSRRQLKMRLRLERHLFPRPFRCRLITPDRPPEPIVAECWPAWRRSAGIPRSGPLKTSRSLTGVEPVHVECASEVGFTLPGAGAAKLIACRPAEIST
jgi:hypothetical protein